MRQPIKFTALGSRIALVLYALAAAACVLLVYAVTVRRPANVEIVTTPAHSPAPTSTPFVAPSPQLPAIEREVETAGDRIAEVDVYLRKRQSANALQALTRARRATARAIESRQRRGSRVDELASTLKGLDSVERAIQSGKYDDAHRQLVMLNKGLDHLDY